MRRGAELWRTPPTAALRQEDAENGNLDADALKDHLAVRNRAVDSDDEVAQPYAGQTAPRAFLYPQKASESIDEWLRKIQTERKCPNREQMVFLQAIGKRLKIETTEELQAAKPSTEEEPLLGLRSRNQDPANLSPRPATRGLKFGIL